MNVAMQTTTRFTTSRLLRIRDRLDAVWQDGVPDSAAPKLVEVEAILHRSIIDAEPQTLEDLMGKLRFAHQIATDPVNAWDFDEELIARMVQDVSRFLNREADEANKRGRAANDAVAA